MSWNERTKETMREEFVKRVLSKEMSKSALCRERGISRPTGDKWISRYQSGETLCDRSRAPQNVANIISKEIEASIVACRKRYPALEAAKIREIMVNGGYENLPCTKTFNNIFQRNQLITKETSRAAQHYTRFSMPAPNDMWQADFKGHFSMRNNQRCHPMNILDDYSRYNLCCEALHSETYQEVKPVLERVFRDKGMPKKFLCDNGNPWDTSQSLGYTRYFNYRGQGYYLSEAFGDKTIAVRETHLPCQITLIFRQFKIGRIDVEKRVYASKRASLIGDDPPAFQPLQGLEN